MLSVREVVAQNKILPFSRNPLILSATSLKSESKVMCGGFTGLRGAILNITCAYSYNRSSMSCWKLFYVCHMMHCLWHSIINAPGPPRPQHRSTLSFNCSHLTQLVPSTFPWAKHGLHDCMLEELNQWSWNCV